LHDTKEPAAKKGVAASAHIAPASMNSRTLIADASASAAAAADAPLPPPAKKAGLALYANPVVLNTIASLSQRIKECAVMEATHRIRYDQQHGVPLDKFSKNFAYLVSGGAVFFAKIIRISVLKNSLVQLNAPAQSEHDIMPDERSNIQVPSNALIWSRESMPNYKLKVLMETDAVIALRIADVFKQNTLSDKSSFVAHAWSI
jgi:hypothetical protein